MARPVTLAQLRTDTRLYADQRPGGANAFVSDTELNRLVNQKLCELYDMLVSARGEDYYTKYTPLPGESGAASTSIGASDYPLPGDFYQLVSVRLVWNANDWEEVPRRHTLDGAERGYFGREDTWAMWSQKGYQLAGAYLRFSPIPTSVVPIVILYVPTCPVLVADTDQFDGVNGWEKLVALGVALEMRMVEQNSPQEIMPLYQEQVARIQGMADERIAGLPHHVIDVRPEGVW